MKSFITSAVFFAGAANALLKADTTRVPKRPQSVSVEGMTHAEHTVDHRGNFKHPFQNLPNNVSSISYPESKSFSTRLHRKPAPQRTGKDPKSRAMTKSSPKNTWWTSIENFAQYFAPVSATYTQLQSNTYNLMYEGPIFLGSDSQQFDVVWDTGSGTLLVKSEACSDCSGTVFNYSTSTSHEFNDPAAYDRVSYLDGTSLYGQLGTDKACPVSGEAGACANTFQFVAISDASGLADSDGILGLWSGNYSGYDKTEMIMPQLKADGDIGEETFSFYMTGQDGQSYIDFGPPNTSVMDGSPIYIDIQDENPWWTEQLTGFRWEASFDADQVEYAITSATDAITDTGSSCIVGPSAEVDYITNTILTEIAKTKTVQAHNGWGALFECPVIADMPKFELMYGGYWFEVLPEDYLVDVGNVQDGSVCALCMSSIAGFDEWILGDVFMRGWYNIHDADNKRMGFVPFTGSSKSAAVVSSTTPSASMPTVESPIDISISTETLYAILIIVGIAAAVTGGVVLAIIYCFNVTFQARKNLVGATKSVLEQQDSESAINLIILQ